MEEILFELLAGLGDALLEIFGEAVIASITHIIPRRTLLQINLVFLGIWYAALGLMVGWASVAIFPRPLIGPSKIHGISLILSPVITGLVMSQVGSVIRRRGKRTTSIESFSYGFVFAFGMAMMRFVLVK